MQVPLPHELLELPDLGELVTRVTAFEDGETLIKPARAPEGITVPVIRLHVPPEDKPHEPRYYDITATTLHPTLRATLPGVVARQGWIQIKKFGVAPRARFTLSVLGPDFKGPAFIGRR